LSPRAVRALEGACADARDAHAGRRPGDPRAARVARGRHRRARPGARAPRDRRARPARPRFPAGSLRRRARVEIHSRLQRGRHRIQARLDAEGRRVDAVARTRGVPRGVHRYSGVAIMKRFSSVVWLSAALLGACGKHPVSPTSPSGTPLSETIETSAYTFHHAQGDSVDTAWQQTFHTWAIAALDVPAPRRVVYNKYRSRTHMGDLTGHYDTNGYAEPSTFTIHTIWPIGNHEVVHVYSSTFGSPVALFNEGIAVAHQTDPARNDLTPRWNGTPLHDWARTFRRQGTLIRVSDLVATADFRRFDPNVTYPEAGSFVRYVLDQYGLDTLKRFFRDGNSADSANPVRLQFQNAYGRDLDSVERDWLAALDAR